MTNDDTRERMAEDLAVILRQKGVTGWLKKEPLPLAREIIGSMLDVTRCDFQDDGVRGDIGGPCRKLRGHDGDHDPFERITPDALRITFGLDEAHEVVPTPEPSGEEVDAAIASLARLWATSNHVQRGDIQTIGNVVHGLKTVVAPSTPPEAMTTVTLQPLTPQEIDGFDQWALARRGRPASRGMIWALRLRATMAERDVAVLHEAARAIRALPTGFAGVGGEVVKVGDEALDEREGIASFLEDWADTFAMSGTR